MRKLNQTFGNVAYGAFSDSNNYATETNNFGETAFGILNKSTIDPDNFTSRDVVKSSKATLFSIGNGTEEERKNVIEIKGNGDVYINGVAGYEGTDTDQAGNIAEEFQGVHDSIDELDRRADETDVEIGEINQHLDNVDSTLDSIHIQKDSDSDLIYTLTVDGEERGTINIPKDQFLEDVSYDPDTKELIFIFVTSDENNKEVRINIENLVDVYSAGNGLSLADGQFSIKLDPSTESYITVGADGLKISGLDSKFDTLTQKDTEQDGRIQTAETDIDALQSDLSALKGDGEGSIGNQIQTAVDALKGGVSESYDTLKKIEDSIVSTNGKFDEYLPLTGGTLTGNLYIQSDADGGANSYKGITFKKNLNYENGIEMVPSFLSTGVGDELLVHSDSMFYLTLASDGSEAGTGNPYGLRFQGQFGDIIWGTYSDNYSKKLSRINMYGFRIGGKSETDLLHAAGGTVSIDNIVTQVQAAIVDSAPETLDTLNELAAALGDDPNFATTVTNQIAQKADKTTATTSANGLMSAADKTKLDGINTSNYATQDDLDGYLPLTGGKLTGNVHINMNSGGLDNGDASLGLMRSSNGTWQCTLFNKLDLVNNPNADTVGLLARGFSATQGVSSVKLGFIGKHYSNMLPEYRNDPLLVLDNFNGEIEIGVDGITISDKTTSDLLNAAGGTTTLKTINGESLLGSGDINLPVAEESDITDLFN